MSIFKNILSKIFPTKRAEAASSPSGPTTSTPSPLASSSPATANGADSVDVEAILSDMSKKNPERLNWRTSIVDLMKLLGLDSSLTARKELAKELNYSGDLDDTGAMNVWLIKQVMRKLADNGGRVPADLTA